MRYCPNCDFDYKVELTTCPECSARLILKSTGVTRAAIHPDDSWVVIGDIEKDFNLDLAKGALEAGNIPSLFIDSVDSQEAKDHAFLLNEHKLELDRSVIMVPKEFEKRAAIVLSELMGLQLNMNNSSSWL